MTDNFEVLVLYILGDIEIIDVKKIIWEKIFNIEDEELDINQIEDELGEIYLSDDNHYYDLDNYSDGYYTD